MGSAASSSLVSIRESLYTHRGLSACACVLLAIVALAIRLLELDVNLMNWVRDNRNDDYLAAARLITSAGSRRGIHILLLLSTAVLILNRWWSDAPFLMFCVVGGTRLSTPLKAMFALPRPNYFDPALTFAGNGFPSGHTMAVTVLFGALLMIYLKHERRPLWRFLASVAAAAAVVVVAATRVYLGAHYPTDVVGGFAIGVLWLLICDGAVRWLESRVRHTWNSVSPTAGPSSSDKAACGE
jgi:undecaprenyl-diphosphatase